MSIPTPPTDVFVWDPALTNATRPTSGHLASGYATNEVPTSTEWNYFAWMVTAWCQLLHDWYNDGDVEVTSLNVDLNAVIAGTLSVNGGLYTEAGIAHTDLWIKPIPIGTTGLNYFNSGTQSAGASLTFSTVGLNQFLRVGDRIRSLIFSTIYTAGTSVFQAKLIKQDNTGAQTTIKTVSPSGSVGDYVFDLTDADHYVFGPGSSGDNTCYFLSLAFPGDPSISWSVVVSSIYMRYDHPTP